MENKYRPLITSLFENDSFINDITAAQEFYNPINTQDILPLKKTNHSFFFFIYQKKQIENYRKCCAIDRVQKFRKSIVVKTKEIVH